MNLQKTLTFKKEIVFKNTIGEITSLSFDRELEIEGSMVRGTFIIVGEYSYSDQRESFNFNIPYSCYLEDNYVTDKATLDVDDFYYEITEPNKLTISIDIRVDNLSEKLLIEERDVESITEEADFAPDTDRMGITDTPFFEQQINNQEDYMTYKVYIVREGDTIETILDKYEITSEQLMKYNIINELSLGDKIIIPHEKNK